MKFMSIRVLLLTFTLFTMTGQTHDSNDIALIKQLLESYRYTEDAGDLISQGKLMASDRVWLSQFASGRRFDNGENIRIQLAQLERRRSLIPGLLQFSEDREPLIKFYSSGNVAIASFYRYVTRVFPPATASDVMKEYKATNEMLTVVMEKRSGDWLIVHTHISAIGVNG
jgi:hypothetical protein